MGLKKLARGILSSLFRPLLIGPIYIGEALTPSAMPHVTTYLGHHTQYDTNRTNPTCEVSAKTRAVLSPLPAGIFADVNEPLATNEKV
jgi:hypothetical protein